MSDLELPVTRYAMSGDVSIAYQTMGDGPIDLIIVPGMVSHVEFMHEGPGYTASLRRLSSFARVVTFDKRGQGLSDRMSGAPSLEQRMDDVRAIMDNIGSKRAALLGISEGSAMSIIKAILGGEYKPEVLVELCAPQVYKKKKEEVIKSLQGFYKTEQLFALQQAFDEYVFYSKKICQV